MPVELYLIRHGLAAERGSAFPDDAKRPLTQRGIARLKLEAKALAALGVSFDQVLTSPLVRTRQTADVIADAMTPKPHIANTDALAPDGSIAAVVDELGKYSRRKRIAVVGHEPGIGELAARLIGTRTAVEFKKGAIMRVDFEALPLARPGRLRWFLTPRMMRRLAK